MYNAPANLFVAGFLGSPAMNFAGVQISETNSGLWAANEGLRIQVPAEIAGRLGGHIRSDVTMGIRPEDLHVATGADPEELSFDAMIEVIEKLGSEILWDLRIAYRWKALENFFQVNDVTDRRYEEDAGFPLPGRTFIGGVTVHFL